MKRAFCAAGGQRQPSPAEAGGLWFLAAHFAAFKLRLFLLEGEREDWAELAALPLCGRCSTDLQAGSPGPLVRRASICVGGR